jgi:hypothetical protein
MSKIEYIMGNRGFFMESEFRELPDEPIIDLIAVSKQMPHGAIGFNFYDKQYIVGKKFTLDQIPVNEKTRILRSNIERNNPEGVIITHWGRCIGIENHTVHIPGDIDEEMVKGIFGLKMKTLEELNKEIETLNLVVNKLIDYKKLIHHQTLTAINKDFSEYQAVEKLRKQHKYSKIIDDLSFILRGDRS